MLEPGLEATVEETVTEADTAESMGSGNVPVLGTPAVLALVERAACRAIDGHLGDGETSVGVSVQLEHLQPTPVGATVRATARLTETDGRSLVFQFFVADQAGECARGVHKRVVVPREPFLSKAAERGR